MDEFEIEVSDMRARPASAPSDPGAAQHSTSSPDTPQTNADARIPAQQYLVATEGLARFHLSRRRRVLQVVFFAVALLLVASVAVGSMPDSLATLAGWLHITPPAPATPLAPGADTFIAADGVPWGTLRVDGRVFPEANLHGAYQGRFSLPLGSHTLVYEAPPFRTTQCIVTVPLSVSDTCPLLPTSRLGGQPNGIPGDVRVVDLRSTPDRLPPAQFGALIAAIKATLAAWLPPETMRAMVAPGERYVAADGSIAIADRPLEATFLYTLSEGKSAASQAFDCTPFCAPPAIEAPVSDVWSVYPLLRRGWSYTDPATGSIEVPNAPPLPASFPGLFDAASFKATLFSVRWTGAWQVTIPASFGQSSDPYSDPTCTIALDLINGLHNPGPGPLELAPIPLGRVADGCLLRALPVTDHEHPSYLLYRFGVFLAVNHNALNAYPNLPVADAAEFALAQQAAYCTGMQPVQ